MILSYTWLIDGLGLHFPLRHLFLSYRAASFTSRGAPIHLHFPGLPIDLQIMVLEPSVAEDHALLPEVRDGKERPFGVGLIMEDYIHHFGDLFRFVRGAVHVEHRYGTRDAPGTNTFRMDKSLSMKLPVAPESKSTLTECTSLVSVVPISIGRTIDVPRVSRVLAVSCLGSFFSHLGL